MTQPTPIDCSESYNQKLKDEIIIRSDNIKFALKFNMPIAALFLSMILGLIALSYWAPPVLSEIIIVFTVCFTPFFVYGFSWLYLQYFRLKRGDHAETHRLAECFRAEKANKRNHCLQALKAAYAPEKVPAIKG